MKLIKLLLYLFVTFIVSILLYGAIALILSLFPKEVATQKQPKTKKIYLYYNFMHSDIILDLHTTHVPWHQFLPEIVRGTNGYLAFGWGDKETYMSKPESGDIQISTALKALFTNTPSLIHAGFYHTIRLGDSDIKTIYLTEKQYRALETSLVNAFGEHFSYLGKGYGNNDAFYRSGEIYNFLHTCNTWTGDRLRESNITMSYWTPLSYNVVHALTQ